MIDGLSELKSAGPLGLIIVICLFLAALLIYFLPSLIALGRHKKQQLAIILLNLFAGWTGIVWLGCLIWAAVKEQSDTATG